MSISEEVEKLDGLIEKSPDDLLMFYHVTQLRSLAARIQLRLQKNDARLKANRQLPGLPGYSNEEGKQ